MTTEQNSDHKAHSPKREGFFDARKATIESLGLLDPDPVPAYDDLLGLLQMATKVPACLLSVFDDDRVFYKSKIGVQATSSQFTLAFSPSAEIVDTGERVRFVEDLSEYPEVDMDKDLLGDLPIRFYAGLGVRAPNGLPVGNICILDSVPRACTNDIQGAMIKVRDLIEDNLKSRSTLVIDHLTGVYKKQHFDDMVRREWARAYRHTVPLTILMIDIDQFKLFNDYYGHQAGDDALRKVGKALMGIVQRAGDVLARYGGEEFVMLLPQTNFAAAEIIAHRTLDAIRALQIEHKSSQHGIVTISIGAAVAGSEHAVSCGGEALIKTADQQLYVSKNSGRNQYTVALLSGESEALGFGQDRAAESGAQHRDESVMLL